MAEKLKLNFRAILFLASLLILSSCGGGGDGDNNPPLSNNSPLAGAGNDQTVSKSVIVTLDASESSDPDNDPLIYIWAQIGGTPVSLNDNTLEQPTFIAPDTPGVLVF